MRAVEKEAHGPKLCCCWVLGNFSDPLNGNRKLGVKGLKFKKEREKKMRILIPVLLLTSCVTLGKLPNISGPSFLLL